MNLSDNVYDLAVLLRFDKFSGKDKSVSFRNIPPPWTIEKVRNLGSVSQNLLLDSIIKEFPLRQFNYFIEKYSLNYIPFYSDNYPPQFKTLKDAPSIIAVCGNMESLISLKETNSISVVGTRKNNSYGRSVAEKIGELCGINSIFLVSGLANGIDGISMRSVLKNNGRCGGVIAGGFEKGYPKDSREIFLRTIENGFCITESDPFSFPEKYEFVKRNRLISALSGIVIIVQAPEKSGALHTARFAFEQGKIIFAVPGRIDDKNSFGTNMLISENMASALSDLNQIALMYGEKEKQLSLFNNKKNSFAVEPKTPYEFIGELGNTLHEVLITLGEMEIDGKVKKDSSGRYVKIP